LSFRVIFTLSVVFRDRTIYGIVVLGNSRIAQYSQVLGVGWYFR